MVWLQDTIGILHVLLWYEQFFHGPGLDVSMAANPHDAYVAFQLEILIVLTEWIFFQANKILIVGISAVIISIFLAVAFKGSLRDHSKTIRKRPGVAEKTVAMKAVVQRITGFSKLKQQAEAMRRGSAGDTFIGWLQQRRRDPHPTDPGQSVEHGNWETGDNKCCV